MILTQKQCVFIDFWSRSPFTSGDLGSSWGCCFLIGRNGSREQIDGVSNANDARDPKNNTPLSFLRSDWLLPEVALSTNDRSLNFNFFPDLMP